MNGAGINQAKKTLSSLINTKGGSISERGRGATTTPLNRFYPRTTSFRPESISGISAQYQPSGKYELCINYNDLLGNGAKIGEFLPVTEGTQTPESTDQ